MIVLNARVILQEKKIRAVQFTNCTALSDATLCQSHLQEKKIGWCNLQIALPYLMLLHVKVILQEKKIGRCNLQIAPPYLKLLYGKVICKKKKFGRCNLQIAPPYLMPVYFSHLQEKKFWAVQFTNCTAQGGRAVYALPFQVQFSDIPENCCRKEKYWSNHLQP